PERITLAAMDPLAFFQFGSLFIVAVDSALYPLETLKTITMAKRRLGRPRGAAAAPSESFVRAIRHTLQTEGLRRLWHGIVPATLGSFPGQATYYLTYETAQSMLPHADATTGGMAFVRGCVAGALAEVTAGCFYIPTDIVTQRLQVQNLQGFHHNARLHAGPAAVIRHLWRRDGPRAFTRGFGVYWLTFAPGSAVQWGAYELAKNLLYRVHAARHWDAAVAAANAAHATAGAAATWWLDATCGAIAGACAAAANNPLEVIRVRTQLHE
ncbi:hypothetical protein CXG81DRAFT_7875, partial [Caulochytrium protostelioides]